MHGACSNLSARFAIGARVCIFIGEQIWVTNQIKKSEEWIAN